MQIGDCNGALDPIPPLRPNHGSTRQLTGPMQTIAQSYDYDAYGVMLGNTPNPADTADTNYLYAGEQYDSSVQQYYNRARDYNPSNGLFNRVDPFAGNLHDPKSLHKYAYCHNNPVNSIDPTGEFAVVGFALATLNIVGIMMTITSFVMKTVQIGLNIAQLHSLADFMIELDNSPIPDLITKLLIRAVVGQLAFDIVGKTLGIGLEILEMGLLILAWSILLRATIGFLRCMKNSSGLADSIKAQGKTKNLQKLLPSPKMHKHHIFPKEKQLKIFFDKAGIKINQYTVQIEQTTHLRGVHGKGMAELTGKWNQIWHKFFANNPNATAKQIFQQAGRMMDNFGLSDLPIKPY